MTPVMLLILLKVPKTNSVFSLSSFQVAAAKHNPKTGYIYPQGSFQGLSYGYASWYMQLINIAKPLFICCLLLSHAYFLFLFPCSFCV